MKTNMYVVAVNKNGHSKCQGFTPSQTQRP